MFKISLVVCQKGTDKQRRPSPDCFWRSGSSLSSPFANLINILWIWALITHWSRLTRLAISVSRAGNSGNKIVLRIVICWCSLKPEDVQTKPKSFLSYSPDIDVWDFTYVLEFLSHPCFLILGVTCRVYIFLSEVFIVMSKWCHHVVLHLSIFRDFFAHFKI